MQREEQAAPLSFLRVRVCEQMGEACVVCGCAPAGLCACEASVREAVCAWQRVCITLWVGVGWNDGKRWRGRCRRLLRGARGVFLGRGEEKRRGGLWKHFASDALAAAGCVCSEAVCTLGVQDMCAGVCTHPGLFQGGRGWW